MAFLSKKDEDKIIQQIKDLIKNKLLIDFKNQKGHLVEEVEEVIIYKIEIDEEKSDHDNIIITYAQAGARVWVRFHVDGKSNDSFYLRNDKAFVFVYDDNEKQYTLSNGKDIKIFIA